MKAQYKCILLISSLLISSAAFAVCPFCTFAVGAGIGLAQYFGVDDTITGIWLGGLVVSLIYWTITWLNNKNIHFYGRKIAVVFIYYSIFIIPLYISGIIGHTLNKLWGIDKLLVGVIIGSVAFFSATMSYIYLKKKNNNKAYFPFQKVIMPIVPLIILTIFFYYLTKL